MRRDSAFKAGGFDEIFGGGSYREETDFACKMSSVTGKMTYFEPRASLMHLGEPTGGVRAEGEGTRVGKLNSIRDSRGDYLFALRWQGGAARIGYIMMRPYRTVVSRYCLRRPWLILPVVIREFVAFIAAFVLWIRGAEMRPLVYAQNKKEVEKKAYEG